MPLVRARFLGCFLFEMDSEPMPFATRKAEALFAYLTLHAGKSVQRDRLAGILWPEANESRSKRNLSTTLWRVKSAVQNVPGIEFDLKPGSITLSLRDVDVDVSQFKTLLELGDGETNARRLEILGQAEQLYKGDFLEGHDGEWLDEERRHLRTLYHDLLKQLGTISKQTGDYRLAISCARKAVAIDSLDEESHYALMLLHHLNGDRKSALDQYEVLKRLLGDELGVSPSVAATELWQYIRSQSGMSPSLDNGQSYLGRGSGWRRQLGQTPLLGREEDVAYLLRLLDSALSGHGGVVVVCGEAGVGKTRLVEALAAEAELRGFDILKGSCPDLPDPTPYQAVVQALWPRINDAEHNGPQASPVNTIVKALAPDAAVPHDTAHEGILGRRVYDSAIVNETLLGFFKGAYAYRPTLLILEDIHRMDKASWGVLMGLLDRVNVSKVLVLVTARNEGSTGRQLVGSLVSNGAESIHLDALTEAQTGRLVQASLRSRQVSPSVARYIWEQTHGIPLFVLEFVKFLWAERLLIKDSLNHWVLSHETLSLEATRVPSRVQEVIRKRIEMLDEQSRMVLCAAAVLGSEMHFDHLHELASMDEEEFVEATDRLRGADLLQETEEGFAFPHESIRAVALSLLGKSRRRVLHFKAGSLLERVSPRRTEDLSWHFREAGDKKRALAYAEASGDKARAVYANEDALAWYTKSLQLLGSITGTDDDAGLRRKAMLLLKRQSVLAAIGDREAQLADIEAAHRIAENLGDREGLAEALYLRADLLDRLNLCEEAIESARRAIHLFRGIKNVRGEARAHATAGQVFIYLRRQDLALGEFRKALSLFRRIGDRVGEIQTLGHLGTVLSTRGENQAAEGLFDQAELLLRQVEDPRLTAVVSSQRGMLLRSLGKMRASESLLANGLGTARRIGDRVLEARILSQLAGTHAAMGRLREAVHEARRARRLASWAQDTRAEILCLNNSAYFVYPALGDFERAEKCTIEAMRLSETTGNIESPANYYDTMAAIILQRGDPDRALLWAKKSETSYRASGSRVVLGAEIKFHLGLIYLERKQYSHAARHLRAALQRFTRGNDLCYKVHTTAALARLSLARGDMSLALRYSNQVSRCLRRIDGLEQMQGVYWTQYKILTAVRAQAAAYRALKKAYSLVMDQATRLKGQMRRRFLSDVRINREILDEVGWALEGGSTLERRRQRPNEPAPRFMRDLREPIWKEE